MSFIPNSLRPSTRHALGVAALVLALLAPLSGCGDENPADPGNPVPVLTSVAPDSVEVGLPGQEFTLVGEGFRRASVITWNGAARPTTYLDTRNLIVALPAADLAAPGNFTVAVTTPAPGGGTSATRMVRLVSSPRPAPTLLDLAPDTVTVGREATLELRGTGFSPSSVIEIDDRPHVTSFVSETRLRATLTAAELPTVGDCSVRVRTPPPGGGATGTLPLAVVAPPATPLRLLFMGNSLTAANALPDLVDSLAAAAGLNFRSTIMATGGYALVDHYDHPERRALVSAGPWDYVIMQQGPSSLPESRVILLDGVRQWEPLIRAGGAQPAMYAVWPDKSRFSFFPDVSESYRLAAEAVHGLFFPVGDTWLETWNRLPSAPLYGGDDFHPSINGSYAAAVVIVSILGHRDPETLPARFPVNPAIGAEPDPAVAAAIRSAAKTVIARLATPPGR